MLMTEQEPHKLRSLNARAVLLASNKDDFEDGEYNTQLEPILAALSALELSSEVLKVNLRQPTAAPLTQLLLLDLPTELLLEALRDAPLHLRLTCRTFRGLLDGVCRSLRLQRLTSCRRRLSDLSSLLQRLPQLRSLDASRHGFDTLPFLAACPSLTALNLSGCRALPDIASIASLTALRSLDLSDCDAVARLAPLAHCPQLSFLRLTCRGERVVDLGVVTALHALPSLVLHHDVDNPPHTPAALDISPLTACASLTLLDVDSRAAEVEDPRPLSRCTRLETLLLRCSNMVTSIAPMAALGASLTHLSLVVEWVKDLQPLSACTLLRSLDLQVFRFNDIRPLAACTCLVSLHLNVRFLMNLRPLTACSLLTTLCLTDSRRLRDISPLAALAPSLTTLSLFGCSRVTCISPLLACTALRHLDVARTGVRQVLPLAAFTQLVLLRLVGSQAPLAELDGLRAACGPRLHIRDTGELPALMGVAVLRALKSDFLRQACERDVSAERRMEPDHMEV